MTSSTTMFVYESIFRMRIFKNKRTTKAKNKYNKTKNKYNKRSRSFFKSVGDVKRTKKSIIGGGETRHRRWYMWLSMAVICIDRRGGALRLDRERSDIG